MTKIVTCYKVCQQHDGKQGQREADIRKHAAHESAGRNFLAFLLGFGQCHAAGKRITTPQSVQSIVTRRQLFERQTDSA